MASRQATGGQPVKQAGELFFEKHDGIPLEKQGDNLSDKQENRSLEKHDGIPSDKQEDSLSDKQENSSLEKHDGILSEMHEDSQ
jgi:hypothetical protein